MKKSGLLGTSCAIMFLSMFHSAATAATVDLLTNGDFDAGPGAPWVEAGPFPIITHSSSLLVAPHSGSYAASLGGAANVQDSLSQVFVIPSQTVNMSLVAHVLIATDELGPLPFDTLTFFVDGITALSFDDQDAASTGSWTKFQSNLSGLGLSAGAHTLTIESSNDAAAITFFLVDTVSINAEVIPLPAAVWMFCSALGLLGWIRLKPRLI